MQMRLKISRMIERVMSIFTLGSRALLRIYVSNFLAKDIIRFYVDNFLDEMDWDLVGWMDWQLEGYH
jgi:hypothetical protein